MKAHSFSSGWVNGITLLYAWVGWFWFARTLDQGRGITTARAWTTTPITLAGRHLSGASSSPSRHDHHHPSRGCRLPFSLTTSSITVLRSLAADSPPSTSTASSSSSLPRMGDMTGAERQVYDFLTSLAALDTPVRLVVVGSGAILEQQVPRLGPHFKLTQSPSTGTHLWTMATDDATVEFHLQLAQVGSIALVSKEIPQPAREVAGSDEARPPAKTKTMRILRFKQAGTQQAMCSLILVDPIHEQAVQWFQQQVDQHGPEIVVMAAS